MLFVCWQGPGQERDDIQELENMWLSAQGRRRGQGAVHSQASGTHSTLVQSEAPTCVVHRHGMCGSMSSWPFACTVFV